MSRRAGEGEPGTGFGDDRLDAAWDRAITISSPWDPGTRPLSHPSAWSGLLGLGFLAYPIADLVGDDPSAGRVAWVGALVVTFVVIIARALLMRDTTPGPPTPAQIVRVTAAIVAIDLVLSLADRPSWCAILTVYALVFPVIGFGGRRGLVWTLICAAGVFAIYTSHGVSVGEAASPAVQIVTLGLAFLGLSRIIRANRELTGARAEIARLAVSDERQRFARDVHDLLGHSLSVITLKAQVARRLLTDDPDRAALELAEIEDVSRRALAETREAVTGARRPTIPGELAAARAALEAAGVLVESRVTRLALAPEDEAVLGWALREGATNIVRHGGARRASVLLEQAGPGALLELVNDGRAGEDCPERATDGNGLRGLTERVAARGGKLEAGPLPGGGFRLAISLPQGVQS